MVHIKIELLMSGFESTGRNTVSRMNSLIFFFSLLAQIHFIKPLLYLRFGLLTG